MVAPDVDHHLPCISNPELFSHPHCTPFVCRFFFSMFQQDCGQPDEQAMPCCNACFVWSCCDPGLAVGCIGARVRPHPSLKIGHHPHVHFIDSRIRLSFSGSTSALPAVSDPNTHLLASYDCFLPFVQHDMLTSKPQETRNYRRWSLRQD